MNALREVSKLSVDVSDLLTRPGTSRRLEFTEELTGLGLDMGQVRTELTFDLLLESLVEGVLVSGQVRGAFALACIRCLRDFESPFNVTLNEILAYEGQPGAEDDYQIVADQAHLEPVVRDAVMLAMPINPLHAPDCKGLCPVCGADRNDVDCGHRLERQDLRWEPLAELKKKLEG
ncbi:MAG: DUF177 domain-containing protein [Actinomycetota bacterium]